MRSSVQASAGRILCEHSERWDKVNQQPGGWKQEPAIMTLIRGFSVPIVQYFQSHSPQAHFGSKLVCCYDYSLKLVSKSIRKYETPCQLRNTILLTVKVYSILALPRGIASGYKWDFLLFAILMHTYCISTQGMEYLKNSTWKWSEPSLCLELDQCCRHGLFKIHRVSLFVSFMLRLFMPANVNHWRYISN